MKNINQNTFKVNTLPDFVVNNRIAVLLNNNVYQIYSNEDRKVINSAEEFTKTMFGEDYKTKVSIEKVPGNSSLIGVIYI